jgi:hypothetical protein
METCEVFKKSCGSKSDPIGLEDWCDIDPINYVPKGKIGTGQCYELTTIIQWIEQTLKSRKQAIDPLSNLPLKKEEVKYLAEKYKQQGHVLGEYVKQYLKEKVPYGAPDRRQQGRPRGRGRGRGRGRDRRRPRPH